MRLIIPGADFSENAIGTERTYTLYQGYASVGAGFTSVVINDSTLTRVRTSELKGSYTVKTKTGFAIRAIVTYPNHIDITGAGTYPISGTATSITDMQGETEYTLDNPGAYSIITFCRTDATQNLSPTDDIVAELY